MCCIIEKKHFKNGFIDLFDKSILMDLKDIGYAHFFLFQVKIVLKIQLERFKKINQKMSKLLERSKFPKSLIFAFKALFKDNFET